MANSLALIRARTGSGPEDAQALSRELPLGKAQGRSGEEGVLDPAWIERKGRSDMSTTRPAKDEGTADELKCPSCGRTYPPKTNGPHFFAKHVATCKGAQATSGRIAARDGEPRRPDPPRAKKSRKRSAVQREKKARPRKVAQSSKDLHVPAISPAAFLEALRAERAKIDTAIAAVEALA